MSISFIKTRSFQNRDMFELDEVEGNLRFFDSKDIENYPFEQYYLSLSMMSGTEKILM